MGSQVILIINNPDLFKASKALSLWLRLIHGILITTKKCYFVDLIIMVLSTFE